MNTKNTDTAAAPITSTVVPEGYRLGFLPRHFGNLMSAVESDVYGHMLNLAADYTGGYWEFVDLSNGGCFMCPTQQDLRIVAPNGFGATVSGEVAGIIATLYALSHLSFEYPETDRLATAFHQLREFALEHAHANDILAAIN